MTALAHPLTWASPRPLWRAAAAPGRAPTILRFASDEFMDQLLGVLASDPARLAEHVARHETWRTPAGGLATEDLVDRVPIPAPLRRRRLLGRLARAPIPIAAPAAQKPLKLYQPAHQRYYIAAATLACAIPGLPDRRLGGAHEQVCFVIRRLMPATPNAPAGAPLFEYGLIKDSSGARWQRISADDEAMLAPGEERLPAFALAHQDGNGLRRTMWGGLIPVGRREEYMSAPVTRTPVPLAAGQQAALAGAPPAPPRNSKLARTTEFKLDFAEGWKGMIQAALKAADEIAADTGEGSSKENRQLQLRDRNLGLQAQSWLLLLDLWAFLQRHLGTVATAITNRSPAGLNPGGLALYNWLSADVDPATAAALAHGFDNAGGAVTGGRPAYVPSVAEALRRVSAAGIAEKLEAVETDYRDDPAERAAWPDFHYLLAGISSNGDGGGIAAGGTFRTLANIPAGASPGDADVAAMTAPLTAPPPPAEVGLVERLTVLVARALDANSEAAARPLPFAQRLAQSIQDSFGDTSQFRLRFIHLNEDCGPLHPPTFSAPSVGFELASFFDPDAPARPVRISLPMDTSPAGLRKHSRGTAFVLSNMLCGQVQRAKGLGFVDLVRQVLPWPLHKDINVGGGSGGCKSGGVDIGMICSLSIPIVTLCALILLLIIVTLLDFIFRWLPWLIFCFPVPKLRGKG
ncbi:MAG TPA: hypothetical protein VGW40_08980 [Allosphingosinicella sp.]|nr:hypothetical protein [Allosphingosinicella sp.]